MRDFVNYIRRFEKIIGDGKKKFLQSEKDKLKHQFGPFVANTHTETSTSGGAMTLAYHEARKIIKSHVNANENDVEFKLRIGRVWTSRYK